MQLAWQENDWRRLLAGAITDPRELLRQVGLAEHPLAAEVDVQPPFPVRVPAPLAARIRRGDAEDPILLQVLSVNAEHRQVPGYFQDPLAEGEANPVPGLLHKYHGRALMIVTGGCAMHCRYCFRRHFPYADNNPGSPGLRPVIHYLQQHPDISEIILSGGDPLMLDDAALSRLITALEAVPGLRRLRIHTRFPIAIPQRITTGLIQRLCTSRLQPVMVIHANCANELDGEVASAMAALRAAGITTLNQSVLLRGVNDSTAALAQLSEALFTMGVHPYYLHLPDPVAGTAHFSVSKARAQTLYRELSDCLPGYLLPRLVREVAGAGSKQLLVPKPQAEIPAAKKSSRAHETGIIDVL